MSERDTRDGPSVHTEASCLGCKHERSERYCAQGDSGWDVYCTHPAVESTPRHISSSSWSTPKWCPMYPADRATLIAERDAALAEGERLRWVVEDHLRAVGPELVAAERERLIAAMRGEP